MDCQPWPVRAWTFRSRGHWPTGQGPVPPKITISPVPWLRANQRFQVESQDRSRDRGPHCQGYLQKCLPELPKVGQALELGFPVSPVLVLWGHRNSSTSQRAASTIGSSRCSLRKILDSMMNSVKLWERAHTLGGTQKGQSRELASEEPWRKQQGWFVTRVLLEPRLALNSRCPCPSLLGKH